MIRKATLGVVAMVVVWLVTVAPASAASYTPKECLDCHTDITPGIVTQYQDGAMSNKGVTCVSCHGADHSLISVNEGRVPAGTCAQSGCHPGQYAEFAHKDAAGAYTNKHAIG
jgi:hydroxylamine dehydrogenase